MGIDDKKMKRKAAKGKRREVRYEPLEPRLLLSADFVPVALDADLPLTQVDELIIDVDLDQVEQANQFVIEGLEPVTVPDTLSAESDIEPETAPRTTETETTDTAAADEVVTIENDTALIGDVRQLMQTYWLDKLAMNTQAAVTAPTTAETATVQEVIVVDSAIDNYQALIDSLVTDYRATHQDANQPDQDDSPAVEIRSADYQPGIIRFDDAPGLRVLVLDDQRDGLDQISDLLSDFDDLAELHIFAHGAMGAMRLGNTTVNADTLSRRASQLKTWDNAFQPEGDILLYGCNVGDGSEGLDFVNRLSELISADVAASDDITGISGDWQLENTIGDVSAAAVLQASDWQGNLEIVNIIPGITDVTELNDELLVVLQQLSQLATSLGNLSLPAELGVTIDDFAVVNDLITVLDFAGNVNPVGTTIDEVVIDLQTRLDAALASTSLEGLLTISGGFDDVAEELLFNLAGQVSSNIDLTLAGITTQFQNALSQIAGDPELATLVSGDALNITLPTITSDTNLAALISLDIDFGFSLGEYLANGTPLVDTDYFIGLKQFDMQTRVSTTNLDATDLINDNPDTVQLGVQDATLVLQATSVMTFANGDVRGRQNLQSLAATLATDLLVFDNTATFSAELPVVAGLAGLGDLSAIGTPIILINDATIGDGEISVKLDFKLSDTFLPTLKSLFTDVNLDFASLDLSIPGLPFEIDGFDFVALVLDPIRDYLNKLFDFSTLGIDAALDDFFALFDALKLFKGINLPGFDWDAPNFDWPGLFGVPDFAGFQLKYAALLERLIPGFDLPNLDFATFKGNIAALGMPDLRSAFSNLLADIQLAFDFELSTDYTLDELVAAIEFRLGRLPSLDTLSTYLQSMLPQLAGLAVNPGPVGFAVLFDSVTKELRFDFDLDLQRLDQNIFSDSNIASLETELNAFLSNAADADFLSSLGIDTDSLAAFDFSFPILPGQVPAFDLRSELDIAFSVGVALEKLLNNTGFDIATDGFFELDRFDAELELITSDLVRDIELFPGKLTLSLLDGTELAMGGKLKGELLGRASFAELGTPGFLSNALSLTPTVPFESNLLFGVSGALVDSGIFGKLSGLGTPVIRLSDDNLLDNNGLSGLQLDLDFVPGDDFRATLKSLFNDFTIDFNTLDLSIPDFPFDFDVAAKLQPVLDLSLIHI